MSVQICILKTGETIIGDIKEVLDPEQNKSLGYKVQHPYTLNYNHVTNMKVSEISSEVVEDEVGSNYTFGAWAPLAAEREFRFLYDFVDCIYTPHKVVVESYNLIVEHWIEQNTNRVTVDSSKTITTKNIDVATDLAKLNESDN